MSFSTFREFVNNAFWYILLGVVSFGVKFLSEMSTSIHDLNQKVAVMVQKSDIILTDHEKRISEIERTFKATLPKR